MRGGNAAGSSDPCVPHVRYDTERVVSSTALAPWCRERGRSAVARLCRPTVVITTFGRPIVAVSRSIHR